ncbi:type III pantothenate kinase [Limnobacter sp.]|uniref:type III pantothenate kinase n=1 Tax=Limnobacter sp. TaxID=2003368 RepID=UPI0035120589
MSASSQLLCIDAGNTMVKLLACGAHQWPDWQAPDLPVQHVPSQHWATPEHAMAHLCAALPSADTQATPPQVLLCSVLGQAFGATLAQACAQLGWPLNTLVVQPGPTLGTRYCPASQLGLDRWAACLAVASFTSSPVNLVLSFGTATTLDAVVRADLLPQPEESTPGSAWVHWGGYIVPGVSIMLNSLASATAQLPQVDVAWSQWPTNTADAIGAGVARMQLGMVLQTLGDLRRQWSQYTPMVWCAGGHAHHVLPGLQDAGVPVEMLPHAVLRGVLFNHRATQEGVS